MTIDLGTDLGQKQAHYIKHQAGRSYKKISAQDGVVVLEFASGQPCFQEHRVRNDLPEVFRVKGGDRRGNPLRTPTRSEEHTSELQSLMRTSYAVFCLKKKNKINIRDTSTTSLRY